MHNRIKQYLAQTLGVDQSSIILERPKDQKLGHYATPLAFALAKSQRKNPKDIAHEIAQKILKSQEALGYDLFLAITPVNGFVNFHLSAHILSDLCDDTLRQSNPFAQDNKSQSVLLEYVSANPTGPLHIGHARGAILGDTLARLGRHLGYQIITEYYINDAGSQIYLLGLSVYLAGRESLGLPVTYPEQYYRGEYIIEIAQKALAQLGQKAFENEETIPQLAVLAKDLMLEEIKSNLEQVNITFDSFVSEKSLHPYWDTLCDSLKQKQALYAKDDKLWLCSEKLGDEKDRVVVRETGEPTYLAGDIIYHHHKFKRSYDHYINIWGADHHGYIARVKAAIALMGFNADQLEVILSQMVTLLKQGEPYKMSKRAGNFILMSDVVDEVGSDVLRFVFLSKKSDTHLEFDVEEFKKQDSSNPVYYINYAHARICTLTDRSSKSEEEIMRADLKTLFECDDEVLRSDAIDLAFLSLQCSQVIEDAFVSRNVVKMSEYLKNLAGSFHRFYNGHKILGSDVEMELLKLFKMVALSLSVGLSLLGITAQKSM